LKIISIIVFSTFSDTLHSMFSSVILDNFTMDGAQTIILMTKASCQDILFPEPGPNFQTEKRAYFENYGPYSLKYFEGNMKESIDNFIATKKMSFKRGVVRRIWILKQMYELFESSMGLLLHAKPKLLVNSVAKALEVLRDPTIELMMDDRFESEYTKSSITRSLRVIDTVYTKIANIVTSDANLLKILPTKTLLALVEYASHKMVSKFRRLPWIDPVLVHRVRPKFNSHWRNFWCQFFTRNFNLDYDICFAIADFMPMNFKIEPFPEFFCRKYNTQTREFFGDRLFDVEQIDDIIKVTLN